MYNFTVDIARTYFVGDGEWLVHNAWCPITISNKKMHQLGSHFSKHGRKMGYASKSEYDQAAKNFAKRHQGNSNATILEGTWNGKGARNKTRQRVIAYDGHSVIIDVKSGQIVDFYQGTENRGLIDVQRLQ